MQCTCHTDAMHMPCTSTVHAAHLVIGGALTRGGLRLTILARVLAVLAWLGRVRVRVRVRIGVGVRVRVIG